MGKSNSYNIVKLLKRSGLNNTHSNIVDESIKEISSWKIDQSKYSKTICLYFLTLGILYLICQIWKIVLLKLTGVPCDMNQAEYVLIIDSLNKKFLVKISRENFFIPNPQLEAQMTRKSSKEELVNGHYLGSEMYNQREETLVIYFRHNKYLYLEKDNCFIPLKFELTGRKNVEIHRMFGKQSEKGFGIKSIYEYNYLLNKYGPNVIKMKAKGFLRIFIEKTISPLYLYNFFAIGIWISTDYNVFCVIIGVSTFLIIFISTRSIHSNFSRLLSFNNNTPVNLIRQFNIQRAKERKSFQNRENLQSSDVMSEKDEGDHDHDHDNLHSSSYLSKLLVPGDIIKISENEILPCDGILLDGYCTVNESDLTGESSLVMKAPLPNDAAEFQFEPSRSSFLFHGTRVVKCISSDYTEKYLLLLVISTGFNTNRGNLLQNLLFPRSSNFKFYSDIKIFVILMLIIWVITVVIDVVVIKITTSKIKNLFDQLTVLLPPTLSISMSFSSYYFHRVLSQKSISCISDKKMNAAGRIDTIVLDKTGTLTEEALEIFGFQSTKVRITIDSSSPIIELDEIHKGTRSFNKIHKAFWRKYCINQIIIEDYQNNPQYNLIFFIECLACCHSIDKLSSDILGNSIDKKIFERMNWDLQLIDNLPSTPAKCMIPKNSYKIGEEYLFGNISNERRCNLGNQYRLVFLKRFEFSSKFQSMSVIVKNCLDESIRYYTKGAPEKIKEMCTDSSLPGNYDDIIMEHTNNGFRVLACASKLLPHSNDYHLADNREQFEKKLTFLGLIILTNHLKTDTKNAIRNLRKSGCKLVMATGDNPFTSISVARECGIIDAMNPNVFLFDFDKEENDPSGRQPLSRDTIKPSPREEEEEENNINWTTSLAHKSRRMGPRRRSRQGDLTNATDITSREMLSRERAIKEKNANYEKEFYKNFQLINRNDAIVCVSGRAFSNLMQIYRDSLAKSEIFNRKSFESERDDFTTRIKYDDNAFIYTLLVQKIESKAFIFYRMSPNDKAELMNFFKENKSSIVSMCGDGANDCGALLAADVGISIRQTEGNSVISHFYSSEESINCIETILKCGRACYENSIMVFKSMVLYGVIQMTLVLILFAYEREITPNQYLFFDAFVVLIPVLLASKTTANYQLSNDKPPSSLLNIKFICCFIGQTIIQGGTLIIFGFFFLFEKNLKMDQDLKKEENENLQIFNSYLYILSLFQFVNVLLIFNFYSKHRKPFYSNKIFIFYISGLLLFLIALISLKEFTRGFFSFRLVLFEESSDLEEQMEYNRLMTMIAAIINFLVTYLYEFLIEKFLKNE